MAVQPVEMVNGQEQVQKLDVIIKSAQLDNIQL